MPRPREDDAQRSALPGRSMSGPCRCPHGHVHVFMFCDVFCLCALRPVMLLTGVWRRTFAGVLYSYHALSRLLLFQTGSRRMHSMHASTRASKAPSSARGRTPAPPSSRWPRPLTTSTHAVFAHAGLMQSTRPFTDSFFSWPQRAHVCRYSGGRASLRCRWRTVGAKFLVL